MDEGTAYVQSIKTMREILNAENKGKIESKQAEPEDTPVELRPDPPTWPVDPPAILRLC